MPDFTMCRNQECLSAEYCERFTAEPSNRQSYAYFLPVGDKCEKFAPNEKYRVFQIMRGDDLTQQIGLKTRTKLKRALNISDKKI